MPRWTPDGYKPIRRVDVTGLTVYSFNAGQGLDLVAYRSFFFELEGVLVTTDGTDVNVRINGNSGSTDYDVAGQIWVNNSTFVASSNSGSGAAQIRLTPGEVGSVNANELGVSGYVQLIHGGSATVEPVVDFDVHYRAAGGVIFYSVGRGVRKHNVATTSVDFLTSNGVAFEKGEISVYGLRRIA